jgi:hypothetical protein
MSNLKFVAVLNKSFEASQLLSALGHISAGLVGQTEDKSGMSFVEYQDKSNQRYPSISECPFIILRGTGGRIKTFREDLINSGIKYSCYLDTMVSGGSDAQREATSQKNYDDINILALATFGPSSLIDPMTKKFSLWR